MMYSARCLPGFISFGSRRSCSHPVRSRMANGWRGGSATIPCLVFAAVVALAGSQIGVARATTLEDAVSIAISTHPTVKKAMAGERAADQGVDEARADFFPTMDVVGEVGYERTDNFFTRSQTDSGNGTEDLARKLIIGEARQNLFEGFGRFNRTAAAKERAKLARHNLIDSAEAIGLRASTAYIDVLSARHVVSLAEENVSVHLDVRNNIQYKAEKGRSDSGDFNQAESRLSLARKRLNEARGQLRDAEAGFMEAVGQNPGTLESPRPPHQSVPQTIDLAVASAEEKNPAVMAAIDAVRASGFDSKALESPYYPKFDIKLLGQGGNDVDGVKGDDNRFQALLVMDYNLYRGGGDRARQRRSVEKASEARQGEAEIRRLVAEQMRIEYTALLTARENLPIAETRAQAAARVVSAYRQQFELGHRSLLDVLDVVHELFEANVGVVNTDAEMMRAYYRVLATNGSLLSALKVAAPTAAAAGTS